MHLNLAHNYKLKAMALLMAALTWGIVKQITNNDKTVLVEDIDLILPEGWAIRNKEATEVYVTFRGTREDLLLLDGETVEIRVDLRDSSFEAEKTVALERRQITYTGSTARIIDIRPSTLTLRLGREGKKQLPVIINQIGDPPEGLKLEAMTATPQLVTLYGAQDLLDEVNTLQTAPLNLSDKIQSFEQRLEVLPPSEEWVGRIDPARIRVKVTLAGLTVERKISGIPLLLYHPAGGPSPVAWQTEPETVEVFLRGSPQLLDDVKTSEIQAFVSADSTAPGQTRREVKVLTPPGIEVIGIQPDSVRLRAPPPPPTPTPAPTPEPAPPLETP